MRSRGAGENRLLSELPHGRPVRVLVAPELHVYSKLYASSVLQCRQLLTIYKRSYSTNIDKKDAFAESLKIIFVPCPLLRFRVRVRYLASIDMFLNERV